MSLSVSRIGEGLISCLDVPELRSLKSLACLCLHGNNISTIEGLQHLEGLQDLNLSSNCISSLGNSLCGITTLTSINLASNRLQDAAGLEGLVNLTHLNLSYNSITSLHGLAALHGPGCKLRLLDVRHNQLPSLQAFAALVGCVNLRELSIAGNPVCAVPNHQQVLVNVVPQITQLDGASTSAILSAPTDAAAAQRFAAQQLASYDMMAAGGHQQQQQGWTQSPSGQQQWMQQPAMVASSSGGSGQLNTPDIDAAMAEYYQRQQGRSIPAGVRGRQPSAPQQQPGTMTRHPANWSPATHSGGGAGGGWRRGGDTVGEAAGARPYFDDSLQHDTGGMAKSTSRIYVVDAAVQTSDGGLVKQLQAESQMLREQLTRLADELERRNAVESQAQQDMQAAIQAAQDDAHNRIEEGYKEASQAVARAL